MSSSNPVETSLLERRSSAPSRRVSVAFAFHVGDASAVLDRTVINEVLALLGPSGELKARAGYIEARCVLQSAQSAPVDLISLSHLIGAHLGPAIGDRPCWVGVGASEMDGVRARREAFVALELGRRMWDRPRTVLYQDVRFFEALAEESQMLRRLADAVEPLAAYDRRRGTRLLETLETFFATNLAHGETARTLRVHRHTVSARLATAERVLGRSVRSSPSRLFVELALQARRLLGVEADLTRIATGAFQS